jgi:hypothetical protein
MKTSLAALAVAPLLLVAGCNHEETSPGPMTTTQTTGGTIAASPVDRHAIDEVASARCQREATCSNIGAGKSYATRDVCIEHLRADSENELTNASCPNGLSRIALDKCLAEIRGERCDHPLDTLARLNACSKSSLCP